MLHAPAIDPDDIVIDADDADGPDRRFQFCIPVGCVDKIRARLEEGEQVHEGAALFGLLAEICIDEAIGRFELTPVWGPLLLPQKESPQPTPTDDFRCAALIDTAPDLDWPAFGDMQFTRPVLDIADAMIDAELEEQLLDAGTVATTTSPAARGDQVTATVEMILIETADAIAEPIEATIRVPADGQPALVGGLVIDGMAEAICGCVAGERKAIESKVPASLGNAQMTGAPMKCTIDVRSVEHITPASISDLVAQYESPNESTLRQQVKLSLEHRFSIEQQQYLTDAVFKALVEQVKCPIPRRVISKEVATQQEQMIAAAVKGGADPAEAKAAAEEAAGQMSVRILEQARRTAVGTLLQRKLKLGVSEQDVESRIRAIAAMQGVRPEEMRKDVVESGMIDNIAKQIFESKATNHVLAEATVRDVPAAEVGMRGT